LDFIQSFDTLRKGHDPPGPDAQQGDFVHQAVELAGFHIHANAAFQANEDRARVSQFFFVTFGTFIAALFSTHISGIDLRQLFLSFGILFLLIALLGAMTMLQLTRLRLAWIESARAMNQIKDEAIKINPNLTAYFRWTNETIPPAYKPRSVGWILAIMVALLSGLAIGSAVAFFSLSRRPESVPWLFSLLLGIVGTILSFIAFYRQPLKPS
jgi:drug/metabolite transporter (DMT)-like permease